MKKPTYRERFLLRHPLCAFCGDAATTIEHCPPRALFQERAWPEGFEFPACESCNSGTADIDLVVSMLARMDPIGNAGDTDGKQAGYMRNVNGGFPRLFREMMPTAVEARRFNRQCGIVPGPGQSHQQVCPVKVPKDIDAAVCVFARKLTQAIFYQKTRTIFPSSGRLALNWFTNADLFREGRYIVFELLKQIGGEVPVLQRAGTNLSSQFQFKWSISDDGRYVVLQALFGNAFGFVVLGSLAPGILEEMFARLTQKTGNAGPFKFVK